MRTWILLHIFGLIFGHCQTEETPTTKVEVASPTIVPSSTTLSSKHEPVFKSTSPEPDIFNKTLEEKQKKLQRIANITIAKFLNNHTRRNLSLVEILELRELGESILDSNFMIPTMIGNSKGNSISKIVLPSTSIMNLGSAILKSDFMPTMLFAKSSAKTPPKDATPATDAQKNNTAVVNATMDAALLTMTFHRKMMNEFLCRNYIAESILQLLEKDAALFSDNSEFSKRQGEEMQPDMSESLAELLSDSGSTRYKDWLDRSAVMTDVYRNMGGFEPIPYVVKYKASDELPAEHRGDRNKDEDEDDEDEEDKKESRKKPAKKKKKKKPKPKPEEEEDDDLVEEEEEEEEDGEDDHDGEGSVLQVVDSHLLNHGPQFDTVDTGWSIFKFGFVDFYDSALTAIAFLTFGIFTLQVFINLITNSNLPKMGILINNSTVTPPVNKRRSLDVHQVQILNATQNLSLNDANRTELMELANATKPSEVHGNRFHKEKEQLKQEMHNFTTRVMDIVSPESEESTFGTPSFELIKGQEIIPNVDLDPEPEPAPSQHEPPERAKLIYTSAEEVVAKFALVTLRMVLKMDDPRCLHAALCRANRATLQLEGPPRLWIPMWSVGMSWLAERAGGIPGSRELVTGALENLKASVLGLAGVKCEVVYPAC